MPHVILTMNHLAAGLAKLNGGAAPGLDGWSPGDLAQLPAELLQLPLPLFQHAERTGEWPGQAAQVSVTTLRKPGAPTPLNLRPISVTPVLCRVWGAARWASMVSWQATWSFKKSMASIPAELLRTPLAVPPLRPH